jgi:hypothetical protein
MGAFVKAPFGELAPYLADFGYFSVPIKPGFKAPLLDDWQAGHAPDHYLPHVNPENGTVTDCRRWGTGILTVTCPAVDLDIRDHELVRVLIELAGDMLGPSPFRVGAPPKALLPFSTSAPFDKMTGRWFALPGDDWTAASYSAHRIEIMGDGQQFVAYAKHPRGTFYRWRRGEPMDTHLIDLPEIEQASAKRFLWAAQMVIRDLRAVPLRLQNKTWLPDTWSPTDFGEPEPKSSRRRENSGERFDDSWQQLDPETLAKMIDTRARQTPGGWNCRCPAHQDRSPSFTVSKGDGGGSVVHCFSGCTFPEIARAISQIVGRAA